MDVKIYIWRYTGKTRAWGHASMSLSDGTHISWWAVKPVGGKGNKEKTNPIYEVITYNSQNC